MECKCVARKEREGNAEAAKKIKNLERIGVLVIWWREIRGKKQDEYGRLGHLGCRKLMANGE